MREGFALDLCDMDNQKTLNDTHGHEAGDRALQTLAAALRSELRRSDEAYRVGGDEFAVVLPGAARLDAERVMRRLRERIEASFGIAVHTSGDDPDRLIMRADRALYETKRRRGQAA